MFVLLINRLYYSYFLLRYGKNLGDPVQYGFWFTQGPYNKSIVLSARIFGLTAVV